MLSQPEFEALAKARGDDLFTIYLPTHPRGQEIQQGPIRLRNLLGQAEDAARERGVAAPVIESRLAPARELLNDALFWRHQSEGLALFCSETGCAIHRLPESVEELVFVGDRFSMRPLLPSVSEGRRYYVLALSQNSVRLLECTRDSVREVDLFDIPRSLQDAVGYDFEEKSLQFHVGDAAGRAMFHGHGRQTDKSEEEIEEFLRAVDKGVCRLLADSRAPLIVAAVDYLIPIYRRVSAYPNVPAACLVGNPDRLKEEELHARSLECATPYLDETRRRDLRVLSDSVHSAKAAAGLLEVLPAARDAKVGTLFVVSDGPVWGRVDESGNKIALHAQREADDEDLIDLTIGYTVANGGVIHDTSPSEMPGGAPVAAILRF